MAGLSIKGAARARHDANITPLAAGPLPAPSTVPPSEDRDRRKLVRPTAPARAEISASTSEGSPARAAKQIQIKGVPREERRDGSPQRSQAGNGNGDVSPSSRGRRPSSSLKIEHKTEPAPRRRQEEPARTERTSVKGQESRSRRDTTREAQPAKRTEGRRDYSRDRERDHPPSSRDRPAERTRDSRRRSRSRSDSRDRSRRERPRERERPDSSRRDKERSRKSEGDSYRPRESSGKRSSRRRSRSSSSSDSYDSEEEERRRRKRRKQKEREREEEEREERRRRRKEKEKREEGKDKEKKKITAASTGTWGQYGVISERDHGRMTYEFRAWLVEQRRLDPDAIPRDKVKREFATFVEDFNTATLPHEKYYNMAQHQARQAAMRNGETAVEPLKYDPRADEKAHVARLRATHVPDEADLTREEIVELRRLERERVEASKRRQLGLEIPKNLGVRTVEVPIETWQDPNLFHS